ncbi:hypothetical protein VSQ32_12980 [Lachnospiraceae bacterium KK002]
MKDDRNLEQLLQQALSPEEEPDDWLNQNILRRAKETESMNRTYKKKMPAVAVLAAAVLCAGSLTAVAAWKYLAPDKVAEIAEDQGLAAAFQSKDAISINESQEYGNYRITLLGVVSGKNLSQYVTSGDTGIREDRTYVVTAIENTDGSPRPDVSDEHYGEETFFVSPLIKGQNPARFNAITMVGGYTEYVQDGIQYRITETDNVEIFADRTLYLAVSSGSLYDSNAYQFDETTGEITRTEHYDGVNALFHLPLDEKKADPEKADAYIRELEQELEGGNSENVRQEGETEESSDGVGRIAEKIQDWKEEDFKEHATLLESLTQTMTPDEKGQIAYSYENEDGSGSSGTLQTDSLFEDGQTGMSEFMNVMGGEEGSPVYVETFTRNEDGTVVLRVYQIEDTLL